VGVSTLTLLVMEQPTRGLDIESALWVWSQLLERAQAGTAIVCASADLDEILPYSNQVLVFSSGQVSEPMPAAELTVSRLGQLMTLPLLPSTHALLEHL